MGEDGDLSKPGGDITRKVFVGGLSPQTTEDGLKDFMGVGGECLYFGSFR